MVVPVGSVTYKGQKIVYQVRSALLERDCRAPCPPHSVKALTSYPRNPQKGKVGTVAQELYTTLTDLQAERTPDKLGWLVPVDCGAA